MFVALTVKLYVPAVVGVPKITPVSVFKPNPAGRLPSITAQVIGFVPLAFRVWLYEVPTVPPGSEEVVIVGATGAASITMLSLRVALPAVLVALTVKLYVPAAVGVPEITPVAAFKLNPVGRPPLDIAHVIGVVPLALSV